MTPMSEAFSRSSSGSYLRRTLGIESDELVAVAWSFAYFFALLASYYTLRSVRETMAIVSGVQNIPWLYTGTFVAMVVATPVFGWLASRFPRRQFLPWVYYFFIANVIAFYVVFNTVPEGEAMAWAGRAFFVWLSVFNLFVVAVFWSFMADIYSKEQSRRLFGVISAGGSAGAFLGPLVASELVVVVDFDNLLPISALLLGFCVYCIHRLRRWAATRETTTSFDSAKPLGGSVLAGIRFTFTSPYFAAIAASVILSNFLGVVLYTYYVTAVGEAIVETNRQTQLFARVDAIANMLSFIGQFLVVRLAVNKLGIGATLAILPAFSLLGFAILAVQPAFAVIVGMQLLRRALGYGISKPTSDMLYAAATLEEKYKAKSFIDTTVWRGADLIAAWSTRFLGGLFGLSGIAIFCLPVALAWTVLAGWLGRLYHRRDQGGETSLSSSASAA